MRCFVNGNSRTAGIVIDIMEIFHALRISHSLRTSFMGHTLNKDHYPFVKRANTMFQQTQSSVFNITFIIAFLTFLQLSSSWFTQNLRPILSTWLLLSASELGVGDGSLPFFICQLQ